MRKANQNSQDILNRYRLIYRKLNDKSNMLAYNCFYWEYRFSVARIARCLQAQEAIMLFLEPKQPLIESPRSRHFTALFQPEIYIIISINCK